MGADLIPPVPLASDEFLHFEPANHRLPIERKAEA